MYLNCDHIKPISENKKIWFTQASQQKYFNIRQVQNLLVILQCSVLIVNGVATYNYCTVSTVYCGIFYFACFTKSYNACILYSTLLNFMTFPIMNLFHF